MGGVRSWLMALPAMPEVFLSVSLDGAGLRNACFCLGYAMTRPARGKKRTVHDVDTLVGQWKQMLVGFATAHNREQYDEIDFTMDDVLTPILTMPVKQLREFYRKLLVAVKGDPQVPYVVWAAVESMVSEFLEKAPDDDVVELKTKLARQIARQVEKDVEPQVGKAIVNALKWRSPEQLQKIASGLKAGKKARLTGRQSCLFLEVGGERVML